MRVIAGEARGRRLESLPRTDVTRPTLIIGLGVYTGVKLQENVNKSNNKEALEQIVDNKELLGELGVNQETIEELEALQQELESGTVEGYNNSDLLEFGLRVENTQMDIIKTKLANTLGVGVDDIKITPKYSMSSSQPNTATVEVNKDGERIIYTQEDFLNWDNNISKEIVDGIIKVGDTQTVNSKVVKGEFDREGAINQYRTGIENAEEIAFKKMVKGENGNISLQEMDNLIQNNEIEQDEER